MSAVAVITAVTWGLGAMKQMIRDCQENWRSSPHNHHWLSGVGVGQFPRQVTSKWWLPVITTYRRDLHELWCFGGSCALAEVPADKCFSLCFLVSKIILLSLKLNFSPHSRKARFSCEKKKNQHRISEMTCMYPWTEGCPISCPWEWIDCRSLRETDSLMFQSF